MDGKFAGLRGRAGIEDGSNFCCPQTVATSFSIFIIDTWSNPLSVRNTASSSAIHVPIKYQIKQYDYIIILPYSDNAGINIP